MAIPTVTDRNVQYPSRVELTEVSTGVYDVTPVPGNVVAEGTDVNKALLDQYAVETQTTASSTKTTPVDADTLPLVDSAASGALKKLTWANLKATLKTYFDTLYAPARVLHLIGDTGEPAFENSWVNYDTATYYPAGFWKDAQGWLHFQGLVKNGTAPTICTLPAGFRPTKQVGGTISAGGTVGWATLSANGVLMLNGANAASYTYLDNLSFYIG